MFNRLDKDLKFILILFILSCVFFNKVLLNPGKIIFSEYFSDTISQFSPYRTFVYETWKKYGQLPLWNPRILMGHPFLGNPLPAMFYPQNLLNLIFIPDTLFGYLLLFDIFMAGLFTYLFMRILKTSRFAAFVAGCVFMFSGIFVVRVYGGNIPNLDVLSMFPLVLLLLELAIRKKSLFYGALAGVPLGLQFLAGQPEYTLYSSLSAFIYFSLRSLFVFKNENSLRFAPRLILIFFTYLIVGLSLSAVQLMPLLELSKQSSRSEMSTYQFATSYSFPPHHLTTFLMPEFYGTFLDVTYWGGRNFWELCVYMGVLPLILALIGIILKRGEYTIIFLLIALFSLVFAFGRYSPIFYIFYRFVPLFRLFRKPSVILFSTVFSVSILSGFGLDFLIKKFRDRDKKMTILLIKILSIVANLTLIAILLVYLKKDYLLSVGGKMLTTKYQSFMTTVHPLYYSFEFYMEKIEQAYLHIFESLVNFLIITFSIIFAFALRLKKKDSIKYFKISVIAIILLDLWFFGIKYIDVISPDKIFAERFPEKILTVFESDEDKFRILDFTHTTPQFIIMRYQVETITGYEPTQIGKYRRFTDFFFDVNPDLKMKPYVSIIENRTIENSKILGLMNVKYVLTENKIENDNFVFMLSTRVPVYDKYLKTSDEKEIHLYENKNFLPRAFVVPRYKVFTNDSRILEEIGEEEVDPREYVILEEDVEFTETDAGEFKKAAVSYYSPNEIHVDVDIEGPEFLVLSENWYPGWRAYDNGVEKKIYRANYVFRSIYLDKGHHHVEFIYDPTSLKIGSWVTIASIIFLCALFTFKFLQLFKSKLKLI